MSAPADSDRCTILAERVQALQRQGRRSKYNARRTAYNGRIYDSAREAHYARTLDLRQMAGEIRGWSAQPRIPLVVSGELVCTYVADFDVELNDGRHELHEVKGHETPVWKLKKRLMEALYPDLTLVVIQ